MFKVALIGCGRRGMYFAEAIKKDIRCEIVALADSVVENAKELKSKIDCNAKIYTDYNEMLKAESFDLVAICLWTPLHLPVFKACAEAGVKIVFSEKPMAPTWDDSLEMVRIAKETGCRLEFSHQRRFSNGNLAVRKLLREGLIGKIEKMDLFAVKNLLDCGTHTIDQAISFNDESNIKWVMGAIDVSKTIQWFNVQAENLAIGSIMFENGVLASIHVGEPHVGMYNGVRIIGDKGFIEVEWEGTIEKGVIYDKPDFVFPDLKEEDHSYNLAKTVSHVFDCYEQGIESDVSYNKAIKATEVIFALYESARRHSIIELPLEGGIGNSFEEILKAGGK